MPRNTNTVSKVQQLLKLCAQEFVKNNGGCQAVELRKINVLTEKLQDDQFKKRWTALLKKFKRTNFQTKSRVHKKKQAVMQFSINCADKRDYAVAYITNICVKQKHFRDECNLSSFFQSSERNQFNDSF